MKLHTVFITYNRLELTKQAIESYLETVTCDHALTVVDNGSTDGTVEWLDEQRCLGEIIVPLGQNLYPGYATNAGWNLSGAYHTHLHRADNDFKFLPGWCDEVERMFSGNPNLGQLGLRTAEEELHNTHNVGGNCIIKRELWDQGLRWDERPWPKIKTPGFTEDSFMSPEVVRMGYVWDRVQTPCIESLADEDPNDDYYIQTWKDRGILEQAKKAYGV